MLEHQRTLVGLIVENSYKRVVEIGVDVGATAQVLLENCPTIERYFLVDPWVPYTTGTGGCYLKRSPEAWEEVFRAVCERMQTFPSTCILRMTSLEAAKNFEPASLDLVFIDGDHSYEAVMADIAAWRPLVRVGGVIGGHDYLPNWWGVKPAVEGSFPDTQIERSNTTWIVRL